MIPSTPPGLIASNTALENFAGWAVPKLTIGVLSSDKPEDA